MTPADLLFAVQAQGKHASRAAASKAHRFPGNKYDVQSPQRVSCTKNATRTAANTIVSHARRSEAAEAVHAYTRVLIGQDELLQNLGDAHGEHRQRIHLAHHRKLVRVVLSE